MFAEISNIMLTESKNKRKENPLNEAIGKDVQKFFRLLELHQDLREPFIQELCSKTKCKQIFNINYPVLIPILSGKEGKINGYKRYYSEPYNFNGKLYMLVNHWFVSNQSHFSKWQRIVLPIA